MKVVKRVLAKQNGALLIAWHCCNSMKHFSAIALGDIVDPVGSA